MKEDKNRFATVIAIIALIFALGTGVSEAARHLIGSAQIKNNSITSKDLRNGGIMGQDVRENTLTAEDVNFPEPEEATPPTLNSAVTSELGTMGTLFTYEKETEETQLLVSLSGAVVSGPATNCVFQVRVNGRQSDSGGGEVFAGSQAVNVSTEALFDHVPAGPVHVEMWARASLFVPGGGPETPSCIVGPANPGIDTTVVVSEEVH